MGWDKSLLGGFGSGTVVAFPYWEVWDLPDNEDRYFDEVAPCAGGVFVCYPGRDDSHTDEKWNRHAVGTWPLDLLTARWRKARCHGSTYLAIADGLHHVQVEYLPDTVGISRADVLKIQGHVFADCPSIQQDCPEPLVIP